MFHPGVVLFWILIVFSVKVNAQEETQYDRKDILKLSDQADEYLLNSNFRESLLLSREVLKQAIKDKDYYLMASAYNTIAGNYDELSEFDKAIANYEKALIYSIKAKNDTMSGWLNHNLGNVYFFEKKQYEKGLNYYQKAIEVAYSLKDTTRVLSTKLNVAMAYFEINEYDKGYEYLKYVNTFSPKHGTKSSHVYLNMLNGEYEGVKGNEKLARQFFENAIKVGIETENNYDLGYTYQEYAKFLNKIGDYKGAYANLERYDKFQQEIYDGDKLRRAALEGTNLQIDEYKRALEKIEHEKQIQDLSIKKSRVIVLLFIVIMLVLLLLLYTLYKNNNFKKKTNLELTNANAELKIATQEAEQASLLKSQFVSTISHELRTPLYGVVGITNMISDEHKELASSPHLQSLKFSAKYLLSLVNDILQINKIEENKIKLEHNIFNLLDEISTIQNSLQFIALRNNNVLSTHFDPAIPEFLIGDKLRLSQIFMNLISNALKFTNGGTVKISADINTIIGTKYFISFAVEDTGIGIAKEDQEKIFEKFVQIERKEDDYQGTGLGLPIVKKLIELFGSEIHLESKEGVGTKIFFTMPFEYDSEQALTIINNIEVDLSHTQLFDVLVVEDNKINQIVTRKIMENHNFKCTIVDNGHSAIEVLEKQKFDVILMDINMPIINGFETTKLIRNLGITTPIVALTAFDKEEVAEEALASGMNDVISKPFEPVSLFQILARQIHNHQA